MTKSELNLSYSKLKASQKMQILKDIEASYCEILADMEKAHDTLVSSKTAEYYYYNFSAGDSCDLNDRLAS